MRKTILLMALVAPLTLGAQTPDSMTTIEGGLYGQAFVHPREDGSREISPRYLFDGFDYLFSSQKWGGWLFVDKEPRYFSFAFGPFIDIGDYVEASAGVGAETYSYAGAKSTTVYMRGAGGLRLGTEDVYAEGYFEKGNRKSEDWYQCELVMPKVAIFDIGAYCQTGSGFGPRLRMSLSLRKGTQGDAYEIRFWASPMYSFDKPALGRRQGLLIGAEFVGRARDVVRP